MPTNLSMTHPGDVGCQPVELYFYDNVRKSRTYSVNLSGFLKEPRFRFIACSSSSCSMNRMILGLYPIFSTRYETSNSTTELPVFRKGILPWTFAANIRCLHQLPDGTGFLRRSGLLSGNIRQPDAPGNTFFMKNLPGELT